MAKEMSNKNSRNYSLDSGERVILKGFGVSPGRAAGIVKIVLELEGLDKVQEGDVLVTKLDHPDMVKAMKKSSAIISDGRRYTSHVAIAARELGKPCVVAEKACTILKDGIRVIVDGEKGLVINVEKNYD